MAKVKIVELDPGRSDAYSVSESGEKWLRGCTLAQLRAKIGGRSSGSMDDPETGLPITIDLSPWESHDPERTLIQLRWIWDNQDALEAMRLSKGPQAGSVMETIRHLNVDHHIPSASISSTPEAQHAALHENPPAT